MSSEKFPTRDEQRADRARKVLASAALELELFTLVRRILKEEDTTALPEFQQAIQFAPTETRMRVLRLIEDLRAELKSKTD